MTEIKRDSKGSPIGVGPGITGASGEFIASTGGDKGVGGTGHESDQDVSGARPDERHGISRQDLLRGIDDDGTEGDVEESDEESNE